MNQKTYRCTARHDKGYIEFDFGDVECGNCSGANRTPAAAKASSVPVDSIASRHRFTPAKVEWLLKAAVFFGIAAFTWLLYRYSVHNPAVSKNPAEGTAGPVAPADFSRWEPEA